MLKLKRFCCGALALFLTLGSFNAAITVKADEPAKTIKEVSVERSLSDEERDVVEKIAEKIVKEQNKPRKSDKNAMVTLLLTLFGGGLGLHRFYVGKTGTGLLWLFTGGVFGIGWIVDLINVALENFKDDDGLPVKF